jgi:hypothetical protein
MVAASWSASSEVLALVDGGEHSRGGDRRARGPGRRRAPGGEGELDQEHAGELGCPRLLNAGQLVEYEEAARPRGPYAVRLSVVADRV